MVNEVASSCNLIKNWTRKQKPLGRTILSEGGQFSRWTAYALQNLIPPPPPKKVNQSWILALHSTTRGVTLFLIKLFPNETLSNNLPMTYKSRGVADLSKNLRDLLKLLFKNSYKYIWNFYIELINIYPRFSQKI